MSDWLLVIAGTNGEFKDFCQRWNLSITGHGVRKARFVSSPERIHGTRNLPFVITGTAYLRDDYPKLLEEMKVCDNFELNYDGDVKTSTRIVRY